MHILRETDPPCTCSLLFIHGVACLVIADVKSMLSVGLTTMSLAGYSLEQVTQRSRDMRILCIGLGGGSLPLFLAHNLPGKYVSKLQ
jgi:hypothetical protein